MRVVVSAEFVFGCAKPENICLDEVGSRHFSGAADLLFSIWTLRPCYILEKGGFCANHRNSKTAIYEGEFLSEL